MQVGFSTPMPDATNVQSLVLHGAREAYSSHLLFHFTGSEQATGFLAAMFEHPFYANPLVQSAEDWGDRKPEVWVNVGLSYGGLVKLRPALTGGFPPEFQAGPWSADSQESLGDGDPRQWWFGQFHSREIDGTVHAYARTPDLLETLTHYITDMAARNGVRELLPLRADNAPLARLVQYPMPDQQIHFGYRDGIGEPLLSWSSAMPPAPGDLNNFIIGYPAGMAFPPSPTRGDAGVLARDGCYLAFTVFYQDVAAFNQFLARNAAVLAPRLGLSVDETQEWIAAKLMGRWRNGSPLMVSPDKPDAATQDMDDYGYALPDDPDQARSGLRCPFSAHGRVANARDQALDRAHEPLPRIIRRGAPYGPPLRAESDDGIDRGLVGLFLCGSLSRQFEKLRGWMNLNDFSPVFGQDVSSSQDALIGNRQVPAIKSFRIPHPDGDLLLRDLPPFVTTRGCAYLLLPSLSTLASLAGRPGAG